MLSAPASRTTFVVTAGAITLSPGDSGSAAIAEFMEVRGLIATDCGGGGASVTCSGASVTCERTGVARTPFLHHF